LFWANIPPFVLLGAEPAESGDIFAQKAGDGGVPGLPALVRPQRAIFNRHMKILLVSSHPDDARAVEQRLLGDGHETVGCSDQHGPCRGVDDEDDCPLHGDIDLTVVARSSHTRRDLLEMGAVCAERARIGVVAVDPWDAGGLDIARRAHDAELAAVEGYERRIAEQLADAVPAGAGYTVKVRRTPGNVHATVTLEGPMPTNLEIAAIADRARSAARRYDRRTASIDVAVVHC
jgi:hypothetical protein